MFIHLVHQIPSPIGRRISPQPPTIVVSSRRSCRAAAAADEGYDLVLAAASGSLGAGRERRDQPAGDPAASRLAPTESEPESGDLRVPLAPIAGSRLRWFSALHPSISPRTAESSNLSN
ncbi:unnamed protein product [Musa textilis]